LDEYTETLRKLADNNTEEAIKFLFRVYDADGKPIEYD
jgi:ribosomal protein S3AE